MKIGLQNIDSHIAKVFSDRARLVWNRGKRHRNVSNSEPDEAAVQNAFKPRKKRFATRFALASFGVALLFGAASLGSHQFSETMQHRLYDELDRFVHQKLGPKPPYDSREAYDKYEIEENEVERTWDDEHQNAIANANKASEGLDNLAGILLLLSISSFIMLPVPINIWLYMMSNPAKRMRKSILDAELRPMLPLLTLTEAEKAYYDALLCLTKGESPEKSPLDEQGKQEVLRLLNELLASYRNLKVEQQRTQTDRNAHPVAAIKVEYAELQRQLEQSADPILRQTVQQHLQMCGRRLDYARGICQEMERLDALRKLVLAALRETHVSLSQNEPNKESVPVAVVNMENTITQVKAQKQAREQAEQEVMTLQNLGGY